MELTLDAFRDLRSKAIEIHASQKVDKTHPAISVDAIFAAIVSGTPPQPKGRKSKTADKKPPEWFAETLATLKERCTVSRFLMMAGRYPVARNEALDVGRWLREAGHIPTKIGGQLIFDLTE